MPAKSLDFQNLSTVQGPLQPKPPTIASAATIEPKSFITLVTGTVAVDTITPPIEGQHMLVLIFTTTTPTAFGTTGNVMTTTAPTQNVPVLVFYDPNQAKYYQK